MSHSVNDPLTELLSDNSLDNDSFFDSTNNVTGGSRASSNTKLKSDLALAKTTTTKARGSTSKIMDDLFGIAEEKENKPLQISSTTPLIKTQNPSKDYDDDDDLGFDPRRPKVGNKINFFEDILQSPESKQRPATAAATTGAMRKDEISKPIMSRQSTESTIDTSFKDVRRSQQRHKTSNSTSNEPLELFSRSNTQRNSNTNVTTTTTPTTTPTTAKASPKRRRNLTPDWLGLNTETTNNNVNPSKKDTAAPIEASNRESGQQSLENLHSDETEAKTTPTVATASNVATTTERKQAEYRYQEAPTSSMAQNMLLMNNMNLEAKTSYTILKQRESQLAFAAQMRNQELALLDMQKKQEMLLNQQEMQFQTLLQQQIQRQQQMEENIREQHQRINTHLQLMMSHSSMSNWPQSEREELTKDDVERDLENFTLKESRTRLLPSYQIAQLEAELKRIELEKLHLIELDESMKTNYERELSMIETSYKKQIKVLEDHLTSVENRLKSEITDLTKHYVKKIEESADDKHRIKSEFEIEIANLKQEHEDEIRRLKKIQENDLEQLREEHKRMLDTIRQAKMLEFAAVSENGNYLETLKMASNNLENISGDLQELRNEMQMKVDAMNREREKKLELREKKIEDTERRLKLTEETADEEKRRLMELVGTLELQLGKLSKDASEENWLLRQKMASIEAEKTSFEREKEFTRAQMVRDEKRVAELKEQQLGEVQRVMLELQEERERLFVERTRIETERKLNPGNEIEKQRLEIEATIKVAQDATRQADVERERYQKMQRQLEQLKRELVDKENQLRAKEDDLEQEISSFRAAERKSQEAQQKARQSEQACTQKVIYLQQRMREVSDKEAALAQERMVVTKERIVLQNLKAKLDERKCSLCKLSESTEVGQYMTASQQDSVDDAMVEQAVLNSNGAGGVHLRNIATHSTTLVDRMLDENIAESMRKMMKTAGGSGYDFLSEAVLDDDSKEMALNNIEEFQFDDSEPSPSALNVVRKSSQRQF